MRLHRPTLMLAMLGVLATGCSGGSEPATTTVPPIAPPTTVAPTTTSTISTTEPPTSATTTTLPAPAVLASIPVGAGGVEYRGGADDIELTGPTLLTFGPDGTAHIYDPGGNRLLSVTPSGITEIDFLALDILNASFIGATESHVVVVEIFFAPERNRIHWVTLDAFVEATVELEMGYRLGDGLSGVLVLGGDTILLEFEGGVRYVEFTGGFPVEPAITTLPVAGTRVTSLNGTVRIGDVTIDPMLTTGLGSTRFLGETPDGLIVVHREDVVAVDPAIRVLSTIEWYDATGTFVGSALVPLDDQYISEPPGIAIAPDGAVYALVARESTVDVVRLDPEAERILEP